MAFVQSTRLTQDSGAAATITYTSNNSAGNFLVLACRLPFDSGSHTVTDTQGNTWVQDDSFMNGGDRVELWHASNCKAGANSVILDYGSGSHFFRLLVAEYSDTTQTFDKKNHGTGGSTSPNSGSITPTSVPALLIGFVCNASADGQTNTPGSGWTQRDNISGNLFLNDQAVSSPGSYAYTSTLGSSQSWAAVIASYIIPAPVTVDRLNYFVMDV